VMKEEMMCESRSLTLKCHDTLLAGVIYDSLCKYPTVIVDEIPETWTKYFLLKTLNAN
jgi:hypothetical protein